MWKTSHRVPPHVVWTEDHRDPEGLHTSPSSCEHLHHTLMNTRYNVNKSQNVKKLFLPLEADRKTLFLITTVRKGQRSQRKSQSSSVAAHQGWRRFTNRGWRFWMLWGCHGRHVRRTETPVQRQTWVVGPVFKTGHQRFCSLVGSSHFSLPFTPGALCTKTCVDVLLKCSVPLNQENVVHTKQSRCTSCLNASGCEFKV